MELSKTANPPGITLDLKKERIRIHQNTMRVMDFPLYLRLLVNPTTKCIIVETCGEKSKGAYHVGNMPKHNGSLELYSHNLIREIAACAGFEGYRSVRLWGRQIRGQNAVFFRMEPTLTDLSPH
jgi:hypothetical protein